MTEEPPGKAALEEFQRQAFDVVGDLLGRLHGSWVVLEYAVGGQTARVAGRIEGLRVNDSGTHVQLGGIEAWFEAPDWRIIGDWDGGLRE